jgi:hypothetical protein
MKPVSIPVPASTTGLQHDEEVLLFKVADCLKDWDHAAARDSWSRLIEARIHSTGVPGDLDIKHLIWMAIRKACLTCASKQESDYLRLVENLAEAVIDDDELEKIESQTVIDKEHQLAQMILSVSKIMYDTAMDVIHRHA